MSDANDMKEPEGAGAQPRHRHNWHGWALSWARNVQDFWRNLCAGVESITALTEAELEDSFSEDVRKAPNFVKARPLLEGADQFDADFFGMYAKEAELTIRSIGCYSSAVGKPWKMAATTRLAIPATLVCLPDQASIPTF